MNPSIKTVGKRKPVKGSLQAFDDLQRLAMALRGNKPFHPRGLFRFKSYEEKEQWELKNLGR